MQKIWDNKSEGKKPKLLEKRLLLPSFLSTVFSLICTKLPCVHP